MRWIRYVLAMAAVGACDTQATAAPPTATLSRRPPSAEYQVAEITSTLGGSARGTSINGREWVAGFSNLPDNQSRHAVLWRGGELTDLLTLGGANSNVQWPGQNNRGVVVGISETADLNPLRENWSCSAFFPTLTLHNCLGFVWESGHMRRLPTLGGYNGFATGVNGRGQIVGWAETRVHDPTCVTPQVLQFRAVEWEPWRRVPRELRPLHGDSTSAATAINDRGQVVGISGRCDVAVGEFSAQHAVFWDHGRPINIGSLGGVAWNTPMALNEAGDVVGFSDVAGDEDGTPNFRAFLWTREGGMKNLGTLPGDQISEAFAVNARRQIVGVSCAATCRPFIWQNGSMVQLDSLLVPGFPDSLLSARDINEEGKITGDVFVRSTGKKVPFVATPVDNR